ncbi:DUF4998 domain-containing protein [Pedobacter psychrodurus]|uniref:DUF4998 domain-containing protein n=1 Tax=Pedobacter psychrodurus TaxID=2530456 RepID=UPI00292E72E7|nr:DUF4998 domain-containing protein [Pedobacter psychrodurus]
MKSIYKISGLLLLLVTIVISCTKDDLAFKDYLKDGEIVYPGRVANIVTKPGNLRTGLWWNPSPDPSISKYVVYWNNNADSVVVNSSTHNPLDTIKVTIPNLKEYTYTFTVYSYDAQGHKSIPIEARNVRVFGPLYQSGLLNRPYNAIDPYFINSTNSVQLNFNTPDTINVNTVVRYTNVAGSTVDKILLPLDTAITLNDYKPGTNIQYKSSYIPGKGSLDVFAVSDFSTFPDIVPRYVLCNRSLFNEVHLPGDAQTYESGTSISKLWDGSVGPQGYPNIFHSAGNSGMPHVITFDLGKVYTNLSRVEETGRDCCNNPDRFEVWGTADLTNATTTLSASDNGWPAEATSKGWTLLKDVTRTDDGKNAFTSELDNAGKPIRYIRIRIKHVTNGDGNYSNMSEIRFWNIQ